MGIFSRLADIVNSNLNALLDRAADPEKIIRLIIQEMEDTLVEVRSQAVHQIAEKKEIERRLDALDREIGEWQRRAELALTKGREDLAKGALAAKARVSETRSALQRQHEQLSHGLERQNEDLAKLQAKLADAKAREKALVARALTATSRIKLRTQIHNDRISDAFARFEQVERNLDQLEGKVDSFDLGRKKTLGDELANLETDAAVETELEALKARLGNQVPAR
ncbi:MAG TPA: phage shock protein PspA [Stellaceae bacterium]|nr:phage shock protein PspA [Stellaceae bacterium]